MADKPKSKVTSDDPTAAFMKAMASFQPQGFGSNPWMGTEMLETMGEIGSELFQFLADRIKEDVKTQQEILSCKEPAKLQEIQTGFMKKAIEQYTAETGKIVKMSNERMAAMMGGKSD